MKYTELVKVLKKEKVHLFIFIEMILFLYSGIIADIHSSLNIIKYIPDIVFFIFIIYLIFNKGFIKKKEFDVPLKIGIVFILFSCMSIFWSDFNIIQTFKELRFYFISFFMYYIYINYLRKEDFDIIVKIMYISQFINLLLVLFQYFVLKLHPDFCNGIFGFKEYDNAVQGIFCLGISIISIIYFIEGKWSAFKSFTMLVVTCAVCAFSEIKAYYVLLLGLVFLIIMLKFTQRSYRKKLIKIIVMLLIVLVIGFILLMQIFPENVKFFFNIKDYIDYENYGSIVGGGMGRLNVFSYINVNVFDNNPLRILFGNGIGYTLENNVYTSGKIYASLGLIGFTIFITFFISLLVKILKRGLFKSSESFVSFTFIFAIIASIMLWNCIFTKACYFTFLLMSVYNLKEGGGN
ncbi:hypothetical protein Aargi30884_24200 [Amedibacterium intestinale]|uniref:Uncharacterized protein n=1 Tax=Amedibacterium intestinale TaxID=2583452 RepID=A0A6N4TLB6_9FIRM|nr:hypothetical protein [Amedibacterium intestinale]BBK23517.1 hypothetical protein Aargi30884_24200 [Amedibacterium intestinale]